MMITESDKAQGLMTARAEPDGAPRVGARTVVLHLCATLLVVAGAAAMVGGVDAGISAAFGVVLAALNLWVLYRVASQLSAPQGASARWAVVLPFKFAGVVGAAYSLVHFEVAQPLPLVIGFAVLPLTGVLLPGPDRVPGRRPVSPSPRSPRWG